MAGSKIVEFPTRERRRCGIRSAPGRSLIGTSSCWRQCDATRPCRSTRKVCARMHSNPPGLDPSSSDEACRILRRAKSKGTAPCRLATCSSVSCSALIRATRSSTTKGVLHGKHRLHCRCHCHNHCGLIIPGSALTTFPIHERELMEAVGQETHREHVSISKCPRTPTATRAVLGMRPGIGAADRAES